MRNLIEIKFENQQITRDKFVIEGQDSFLRLCDGQEDIVDDVTWYAGLLTKDNDFIYGSALNVNIQTPTDFTIKILDDGLYNFLTLNNIDLNKCVLTYLVDFNKVLLSNISVISLIEDTLEITSTSFIDKMNFSLPMKFYGNQYKRKLSKETNISQEYTQFVWKDGVSRDYPEVIGYAAWNIPGVDKYGSWVNGVLLFNNNQDFVVDKRSYLKIKHYNEIEFVVGSSVTITKAYNSQNQDAKLYVKDSVSYASEDHFLTYLYFDDVATVGTYNFPSHEITTIDTIKIRPAFQYFEVPYDIDKTKLKIYTKSAVDYSEILQYDIEEMNGRKYIKIKPFTDAWYKIKIDDIKHKSDDSIIVHADTNYSTSALTTEIMSDFYAWKNISPVIKTEQFEIISDELKTLNLDNLYFGMKLNIPNKYYHFYTYFNIVLNSGKFWPGDGLGTKKAYDDNYRPYYAFGWGRYTCNPTDYDSNTIPLISSYGDSSAISNFLSAQGLSATIKDQYISHLTPGPYLSAFESDKVFKFPDIVLPRLNEEHKLLLTLDFIESTELYLSYDPWWYIINKFQLLTKITIDPESLSEIYVDYTGNTTYDAFVAQEILTSAGLDAYIEDLSIPNKVSFMVESSEILQTVLQRLTSETLLRIKQNNLGEFIISPYSYQLPDSSIFEVFNFSDNTMNESICFPKIILGEESIELINLEEPWVDIFNQNSPWSGNKNKNWKFSAGLGFIQSYSYNDIYDMNRVLKYTYEFCLQLYKKNILNKKDITIPYTQEYLKNNLTSWQTIYFTLFQSVNSYRIIDIKYGFLTNLLGSYVKFRHPKFFNNSYVIGLVIEEQKIPLEIYSTKKILISSIEYQTEPLSIYDQGAGSYDKYIDQGFSDKLILKDK